MAWVHMVLWSGSNGSVEDKGHVGHDFFFFYLLTFVSCYFKCKKRDSFPLENLVHFLQPRAYFLSWNFCRCFTRTTVLHHSMFSDIHLWMHIGPQFSIFSKGQPTNLRFRREGRCNCWIQTHSLLIQSSILS